MSCVVLSKSSFLFVKLRQFYRIPKILFCFGFSVIIPKLSIQVNVNQFLEKYVNEIFDQIKMRYLRSLEHDQSSKDRGI